MVLSRGTELYSKYSRYVPLKCLSAHHFGLEDGPK